MVHSELIQLKISRWSDFNEIHGNNSRKNAESADQLFIRKFRAEGTGTVFQRWSPKLKTYK